MTGSIQSGSIQPATLVSVATALSKINVGTALVSGADGLAVAAYPNPLGYLDTRPESLLGSLLTPINPSSVSFEAIKQDLVSWAKSKPDGVAWTDWFETDDGTIIAEWIAGLGTFRKIAETLRIREGSLDFAQLESSLYEIAFRKGLLLSPSSGLVLSLSLRPNNPGMVVRLGDFVGNIGNYEMYSLEGKSLLQAGDTLRVVVGHLNSFTPSFSTLARFSMFSVPLKGRYVAQEMESFQADGVGVSLVSEPNNLGGFGNSFILRRVLPSQVRLYVGNGAMGWYKANTASLTYSCISYDDVVRDCVALPARMVLDAGVVSVTELQPPSYSLDKETLRAITRYYPIDSRIVTDHDYEAVIRKYFGGVLYDVVAYNSDPDEQVLLLPSAAYGLGTPQEVAQTLAIQSMVDDKRGLGMRVTYTLVPPSAGKTFVLTFAVGASQVTFGLQQQINDITASQLNRFARIPVTLTAVDYATQLSARFGFRFRPLDPGASVTLGPTDFLATFDIGLVAG